MPIICLKIHDNLEYLEKCIRRIVEKRHARHKGEPPLLVSIRRFETS